MGRRHSTYQVWKSWGQTKCLLAPCSLLLASFAPGCGQLWLSAEALSCLLLCVMEVVVCDGWGVADAAAAGVAGEHKALVAVETASEDTQQDAECGSGPLVPGRLGATVQAAPLHQGE